MRTCNICKIDKDLDEYHNVKSFPLGKAYTCKECANAKSRKWTVSNKDKKAEQGRKHYQANKQDYMDRANSWAKSNRGYNNARWSKRHALKLNATVSWADLEQIKRIYVACSKISKDTGKPHEVDHIIPLQGKNVCGLHIETNLRIVPRQMNRAKGNRY